MTFPKDMFTFFDCNAPSKTEFDTEMAEQDGLEYPMFKHANLTSLFHHKDHAHPIVPCIRWFRKYLDAVTFLVYDGFENI